MSDPQGPSSDEQRTQVTEMLRQALNTLNGGRGDAATGLTPEALTELARRAGVTNPAQIADLQRMMGLEGSLPGAGTSQIPQHIVFQLADFECALPADAVQGVERVPEIALVPNTVSWVMGVTQVLNTILSIVDLRAFFGLPTQQLTSRSRVVVVTKREMAIGFLVDEVREMRALGDSLGRGDPRMAPDWARPYLLNAALVEGRFISVLDPEQLLFGEKIHRYRAEAS